MLGMFHNQAKDVNCVHVDAVFAGNEEELEWFIDHLKVGCDLKNKIFGPTGHQVKGAICFGRRTSFTQTGVMVKLDKKKTLLKKTGMESCRTSTSRGRDSEATRQRSRRQLDYTEEQVYWAQGGLDF